MHWWEEHGGFIRGLISKTDEIDACWVQMEAVFNSGSFIKTGGFYAGSAKRKMHRERSSATSSVLLLLMMIPSIRGPSTRVERRETILGHR